MEQTIGGGDPARLAIDGGTAVRAAPYETTKGLALFGAEEEEAAVEVLRSRSLFRYYGPALLGRCDALEAALGHLVGVGHGLVVSSGTAALTAALIGLQIPPGAEVIVPAVTFVASANAVIWARGVPVFAEVDASLMLDPSQLEARISERTFAILPVHLGNAAADMGPIRAIADRHGLHVLEDAAQALGIAYHGVPVGSLGSAAAVSFQLDKNIAAGEGGAVLTDDAEVHERAARYHDQGGQFTTSRASVRGGGQEEPFAGVNLRMTELAAAVALVQLGRLDGVLARLRALETELRDHLADLPVAWRPLPDPGGAAPDLTMLLDGRIQAKRFVSALQAEGIPATTLYGGQPVYANPAIQAGRTAWGIELPPPTRCRASEQVLGRSVTIPLSPAMSDGDAEDVVRATRKVAEVVLDTGKAS